MDHIRVYYLEPQRRLALPSLYLQLLFIYLFILTDGSSLGSILLIILIAESQVTHSRPAGDRIFLLSLTGCFCLSLLAACVGIRSLCTDSKAPRRDLSGGWGTNEGCIL